MGNDMVFREADKWGLATLKSLFCRPGNEIRLFVSDAATKDVLFNALAFNAPTPKKTCGFHLNLLYLSSQKK